jgi:ABC-2 type transport system permease protein
VTSDKPGKRPSVWAEALPVVAYAGQSCALAQVELIKLLRDPTELFSRAIQPILWLAIFGQVFSRVRGVATGGASYLDFMTPGILAQSVLFSAIFYGISAIWEKDLGIVQKLLVSPANRGALVIGKAIAAAFRGLVQTGVIYVVALAMGVAIRWDWLPILGVLLAVIAGSAIFSTFSLIIACLVKTRERFMGIGQVLTMPLFFASNAIYPVEMMPPWLKVAARINPLTYLVDALRGLMILQGPSAYPYLFDLGLLTGMFVVLLLIAAKLYPALVR